ncbi:MAG: acyl-CoA dehydrogenase family protein [Sphingobium sp.]
MDYSHSEDRQMVVDTLARYVQQRYPIDVRHHISESEAGWSQAQWAELADLGMIGVLFAEQSGGFGGNGFDIGVVFEQIGRGLVVEPFLGALMAGKALELAGGQEDLIAEVIAGSKLLAFGHEEEGSRYDLAGISCAAQKSGEGWLLTGSKTVVPQLEAADHIVVSARVSGSEGDKAGIALFLVDKMAPGVSVRGYPMIDGGRGGELSLLKAEAALLAEDAFAIVEQVVATGAIALCWEAVGVMDVLKHETLEYLRTRKQFGVPIGKFQALQHRMATVALEIEQARSAAINAAAALGGERVVRERAASAGKYTIDRVGTLVAEEAIQMHGGIGMTWELPLSHYAKRLTMIGHQLGDEDHHLARFIDLGYAAT